MDDPGGVTLLKVVSAALEANSRGWWPSQRSQGLLCPALPHTGHPGTLGSRETPARPSPPDPPGPPLSWDLVAGGTTPGQGPCPRQGPWGLAIQGQGDPSPQSLVHFRKSRGPGPVSRWSGDYGEVLLGSQRGSSRPLSPTQGLLPPCGSRRGGPDRGAGTAVALHSTHATRSVQNQSSCRGTLSRPVPTGASRPRGSACVAASARPHLEPSCL